MKKSTIMSLLAGFFALSLAIYYVYTISQITVKYDFKSRIVPFDHEIGLEHFIANRKWSDSISRGSFTDESIWLFYGDGKFRHSMVSDYVDTTSGTWNLVDLNEGKGLIYIKFITTQYEGNTWVPLHAKRVLFIEAKNKHLNINFQPHWGEITPEPPQISTDILQQPDYLKKDFPEYSTLIGSKWVKDNDVHKNSEPHELTFYGDGTFYANYVRTDPCNFTGHWSLHSSKSGRVEIELFASHSRCDLRGYKGFGWGGGYSFTLTNTSLVNDHFDYLNYHR